MVLMLFVGGAPSECEGSVCLNSRGDESTFTTGVALWFSRCVWLG